MALRIFAKCTNFTSMSSVYIVYFPLDSCESAFNMEEVLVVAFSRLCETWWRFVASSKMQWWPDHQHRQFVAALLLSDGCCLCLVLRHSSGLLITNIRRLCSYVTAETGEGGIHHSSSGWPHLEMMTRGWNNNLIIILPRHHKETLNIVSDSDSGIKSFKTLQQDTCLIKSNDRHPDPHYLLSRTPIVTRTGHKKSCRRPPSSHLAMPPRSGLHDNLYPCLNS